MDNIQLNKELFNAVFKKDLPVIRSILKEEEFSLIKLKSNDSSSNILHYAFWDFDLFLQIFKLEPSLIKNLNSSGESPLFALIRKNKFDSKSLIRIMDHTDLNIVNNSGESLLDFIIKSNSFNNEEISFLIKENVNITEESCFLLYRRGVHIHNKFPKEIKTLADKMYYIHFSNDYILALNSFSAESFMPSNSKKFLKLFTELTAANKKEDWPHVKLQILLILKKYFKEEFNPDVIFNLMTQPNIINYGFINQKHYNEYISLLKIIKPKVSINSFFNLLIDLFQIESPIDTDLFKQNLSLLSNIKKIKTWKELQEKIKNKADFIRMQTFNEIELHQQINVLNNKMVGEKLRIRVPQKQEELINASYFLNICVGKSLHYTKKIKNFESLIIFLDEIKNNKPLYCLELSTSQFFKIVQAKGLSNSECPSDIQLKTQKLIDTIMGRYI